MSPILTVPQKKIGGGHFHFRSPTAAGTGSNENTHRWLHAWFPPTGRQHIELRRSLIYLYFAIRLSKYAFELRLVLDLTNFVTNFIKVGGTQIGTTSIQKLHWTTGVPHGGSFELWKSLLSKTGVSTRALDSEKSLRRRGSGLTMICPG